MSEVERSSGIVMPAVSLTDEEIDKIVAYIKSLK